MFLQSFLISQNTLAELKGLAADSLALLRAALYDARFPALFELELYGAIVGIFELNNLGKLAKSTTCSRSCCFATTVAGCCRKLLARHCPVLFLVRHDVVWVAGIVVESPVEQYLLFMHEEQEGVLSEKDRDAMRRSIGAPRAPHPELLLCKPSAHCLNPLLNSM